MTFTAKLEIEDRVSRNLRNLPSVFQQAASAAVRSEIQEIERISRNEQIPFDTGEAFDSWFLNEIDALDFEFGYGADHALTIHENLRNVTFKNGKKSHFLRDPVLATENGREQRIWQTIEGRIAREFG